VGRKCNWYEYRWNCQDSLQSRLRL
jgi:hypothetical protein